MKVVIFGTGKVCVEVIESRPYIKDNVIAFLDNDNQKWGNVLFGRKILDPRSINMLEYDFCVIATTKYAIQVTKQCICGLNIDPEKIIDVSDFLMAYSLPEKVRLDICTLCQLKCAACDFRVTDCWPFGLGYTKIEDFKNFIDKHPFIKTIEISRSGEPFLNPDMKEILEYAHEKGVIIEVSNGTNFNTVSDEVLETLVRTQVRTITVALDGTSQEVYSKYRRNGNFEQVIDNIKKVNKYKKLYGSKYPILLWQFILMEHNEHQALEAKEMAKALGMDIFYKLTWEKGFVSKNPEWLKEVTGLEYLSEEEIVEKTGKTYMQDGVCAMLFNEPQLNWDGRLYPCCCCMTEHGFGVNVFETGLKDILLSKEFFNTKRLLWGEDVSLSKDNPCLNCYRYEQMKKSNIYLRR